MNLNLVVRSWGRALAAHLHYRMLLLSLAPLLAALALWAVLMYFGMQALVDAVHGWLAGHDGFGRGGQFLALFGLLALKTLLAPLLALWLLLPLLVLTALLIISLFAMPLINRHVTRRHYAALEQRRGGSAAGSLWHTLVSCCLFLLLWLASLPLMLFPPLGMIAQPLLWGWLTYRVMVYDALARHADADERAAIVRQQRGALLTMGVIAGMLGVAPAALWIGGVFSFLFLPLLAAAAVCLYVLVFVFTGLWFQYFCLEALRRYRETQASEGATWQSA